MGHTREEDRGNNVKKSPVPWLGKMVEPLLLWYDEHARILPWRENTAPYPVWVSEIMLQQTRVETVKPYFDRFMAELPDVQSLAEAEEAQLLKLWEGLGYYNRVRNLQRAAQAIMAKHQGVFPSHYEELLLLPGVGVYTAGAISSICFKKPIPAVDGNVLRVVARMTENQEDIHTAKVKNDITEQLRALYPTARSGDFTQSLMELGAMVCTPGVQPKCEACPLNFLCKAYENGTQWGFPVKSKRKTRKKEQKTVFLLCCGDQFAVRRRVESGLLGGLWEFPNVDGQQSPREAKAVLADFGIEPLQLTRSIRKKHIFTHIEWEMTSYLVLCKEGKANFLWVTKETLENELTLPSAFKTFCQALPPTQ